MKIILASKSQRRRDILEKLNIDFDVKESSFDESTVEINHNEPERYCLNLAYKKAEIISYKFPDYLIIGADTIVYHNNKVFGKPQDKNDAISQLMSLSNSTHIVYTGVSLLNKNLNINEGFVDSTFVTFNELDNKDILYYIENYKPFDKAGSYGIQDWSSIFVDKIEGCFYNVVGFPVPKFYKLLKNILSIKQ